MRFSAGLASAIVVVITVLSSVIPPESVDDTFGVKKIYSSAKNGMNWSAQWDGAELGWSDDPWVELGSRDIRLRNKDGVLTVSGETSRIYVRDPDKKRQWTDVEVTVYAKRVADDGVPYSGIVSAVRTNHGMAGDLEQNPCDSRGLSARLRFDGNADFGKETSHPTTIATRETPVFQDGLPYNEWIGYKHIVYDIAGGTATRQELWMDLTGGKGGGVWKLVASHDDYPYSNFGEVSCAPGIDPGIPYVNGPRAGSESGLPSLSVLFRADSLGENGLQYKWASVREIKAPKS